MDVENPEIRRVHMSLQVVTCGVRRSWSVAGASARE
jgi:hypothetical protein